MRAELRARPGASPDGRRSDRRRAGALPTRPTAAGRRDVALVAALALLAFAVRWPELMTVPRISDETLELLVALRIARGEALPLTNATVHIGPLFNYLVAAALLVLGPAIEAGRLVVLLFGALTVVPTYLLGRRIGGRSVGALAALFLATSSVHTAVNSHLAYSHAMTPFFSMLGLWLLHRAVRRRSERDLVAAGLALGLALQTHPSAVVTWPGLAAYLLWRGRALVGRPALLAAGAALLAIGNLVIFNLSTGLRGLELATARSASYTDGSQLSVEGWTARLLTLLRSAATALGGLASEYEQPAALLEPLVVAYSALAIAGLVLLCRRREWLPALAIVSGLLLVSLFNGRVEPVVPRARHYALLLPVAHLAAAVALMALYRQAGVLLPGRRGLVGGAALIVVTVLAVGPLLALRSYYDERLSRSDKNNRPLLEALAAIDRDGRPDERVYLDEGLAAFLTLSGGRMLTHLHLFLSIREQEHRVVRLERDRLPVGPPGGASRRLIIREEDVERAERHYALVPLPGEPGPGAPIRVFRAFAHPSG